MAVAKDPDSLTKEKAEQEALSSQVKLHHSRLRTELKAGKRTCWPCISCVG